MTNFSGFGTVVTIQASNTVPFGYVITQFADDVDVLDIPSVEVGSSAMGINGDLIRWSKPVPLPVNISVIPGGVDDKLLGVILEANRVGQGKQGANDIITLNIVYPNNSGFTTFSNGLITNGMLSNSISTEGRLKTKTYSFSFQNKIGI